MSRCESRTQSCLCDLFLEYDILERLERHKEWITHQTVQLRRGQRQIEDFHRLHIVSQLQQRESLESEADQLLGDVYWGLIKGFFCHAVEHQAVEPEHG